MSVNQLSDEYVKQLIITTHNTRILMYSVRTKKNMVKKWLESMGRKHTTPHQDLKYILLTAQIFGVLPVEGVTDNDVTKLKFRWCTFRVFYSIFLTIPTFVLTALAFYRVSQEETDAVSKFSK